MLQPIHFMLWWKGEMMGVTWMSLDQLATPKRLGGAPILESDLEMHLMARRFALLRIYVNKINHGYMMQYFVEHEGLVHGKTKIQASWWSLLNGSIPLKI